MTLIKFFILTGNFILPLYAGVLFYFTNKSIVGLLMLLFICFSIIERAWETFRTSKERRRDEIHGDWTLAAVTGTYLILFFIFVSEFYFFAKTLNVWITCVGMVLWLVAFRLRWWGMAALGKQWAVHAVGAQKIKNIRLIKIGPYKYVRHPIYLSIMMEEMSFPMIANTYGAFFFAIFVCVPFVILRARLEEKSSIRRFGPHYEDYKKEVDMFFPIRLLKH